MLRDFKNCNYEILKKCIKSLNRISYKSAEAVHKVTT